MARSRSKAKARRFQLLGPVPGSDIELDKSYDTPGAVLSRALTEAVKDPEPSMWEVREWDDLLYRVHRLPGEKLDVRVEVMR